MLFSNPMTKLTERASVEFVNIFEHETPKHLKFCFSLINAAEHVF